MNEETKFPTADRNYTSFDGSTAVRAKCYLPDRYCFWDRSPSEGYLIPRGAGLSYTAASFSPEAITTEHKLFNRILAYDEKEHTLEVEAGITLGEVYAFLTPRGRFLAVQPGHPLITVGGCAAPDVHGKNQFRDGTFVSQVKSVRLFHPRHGTLSLSDREDPDVFRLTCGGYGLTGNLLSVTLRTKPIHSPIVQMRTTFLPDAFALPKALMEAKERADLVFTWHDFTAKGRNFGRGFLKEGSFADASASSRPALTPAGNSLSGENRGDWILPFFNSLTVRPFNRLYFLANRLGKSEKPLRLYDFIFPVHDKESYFKLFGRSGFHEYQAIIPWDRYEEYVDAVKHRLHRAPLAVTLASAKAFQGTAELLRFSGSGISLALNFPRNQAGLEFAQFLDEFVLKVGALPNLIKDSRLGVEVVKKTYPGYEIFRERLRRFDPERRYRSLLSERLKL